MPLQSSFATRLLAKWFRVVMPRMESIDSPLSPLLPVLFLVIYGTTGLVISMLRPFAVPSVIIWFLGFLMLALDKVYVLLASLANNTVNLFPSMLTVELQLP